MTTTTYTLQVHRFAGPDEDYEELSASDARAEFDRLRKSGDVRMLTLIRDSDGAVVDEWVRR